MEAFIKETERLNLRDRREIFGSNFSAVNIRPNGFFSVGNKDFVVNTFADYIVALNQLKEYANLSQICYYKVRDVIRILNTYERCRKGKEVKNKVSFQTLPDGSSVTHIEVLGHQFVRFPDDIVIHEYATVDEILSFIKSQLGEGEK